MLLVGVDQFIKLLRYGQDEEIALEDLAGAVTPRGQVAASLPRLLELVLAPDFEPYAMKPEVARAIARGVPALAEAAQEWAGGGDGESLSQLLAERAVERDAPGRAACRKRSPS